MIPRPTRTAARPLPSPPAAAKPLTPREAEVVRKQVTTLLDRSRSFRALPAHDRIRIAHATTAVAAALAADRAAAAAVQAGRRPGGRAVPAGGSRDPYAIGLDDPLGPIPGDPTAPPPTDAPGTAADKRWRPDDAFKAESISAGVDQIGRLINEVDFPGFVASLVKGTFQAIVDASIQQMKAYGDLVQSVAMSLNDFRDQNVDEDQGRQRLLSKYPQVFSPSSDPKGSGLQINQDLDSDSWPDFQKELNLPEPVSDLDDDVVQNVLIPAARTDVARGRQQLLATTIVMGINRIIITDGKINAKLKFTFNAADALNRTGTVDDYQTEKKVMDIERGIGDRYVKGHFEQPVPIKVSTTTGQSAAQIQADAQLSGEVSINFRSETFPLERLVNTDQLLSINQAQAGGARAVPPAPAAPIATPAALPAPAAAAPAR